MRPFVNMRFIKPFDNDLVASLASNHELLVTVEENTIMGGAGSAVLECSGKRRHYRSDASIGSA